ncbi:MAG TPA: hypothetical protein VGH38_23595 [Bryobacteraceae bacterium]|jgi:hypothetical protein
MKLADLRKFTIRKQFHIRFRMRNGMECVITDRGIAQVPDLKGIPDFSLEDELGAASEFVLESASVPDKKNPVKPRSLTREELARMTVASSSPGPVADHDDD